MEMTIACIGEVVVDWLSKDFGKGHLDSSNFVRAPGGNALNVAFALARLGAKSRLLGKIGDDIQGQYLLSKIKQQGVDSSFIITDNNFPTTQCYVYTAEDGRHSFYEWPLPHAAQMLCAEEIDPESFSGAEILHTTGISIARAPRRQAIVRAVKEAKERKLLISFDASLPPHSEPEAKGICEEIISQADILKFNQVELTFWSGITNSPEQAAKVLFEKFKPSALFATMSAAGSLVLTADSCQHIKSFPVKAVDEVGAGDAFVAGALYCLSKQISKSSSTSLENITADQWAQITSFANATGALSATHFGAVDGLPTLSEVNEFIEVRVM